VKQQLPSYSTNTGGIDCYLSQTPVDTSAAGITVIDQP
jgi:hypothetical protein